tara:strand:- start:1499 stop:2464 length:966 start_codon:yes stop_codon:yes gene_type:complete
MSTIRNLFKSFVSDIIKVFPEYEKRLGKCYGPILSDSEDEEEKNRIFNSFLENIEEISDEISKDDFQVFEKDPVILQNVSFKVIWKSDISKESKGKLWKYLQSFCIHNINQGEEDISEVLKKIEQNEKVSDKKTLQNIKKLKRLTESMNKEIDDTEENQSGSPIDDVKAGSPLDSIQGAEHLKQFDNILENSGIGKIAKEVTEELDIEGMLKGGGGIEDLMKGDNMINIFKSISGKIESSNGDTNMMEEALNITKNMKDNPLFSSLMGSLNPNMQESMRNQENRNVRLNEASSSSSSHDGSDTRRRLQQKLKNKTVVNKKD